jgi:hypothetical protein
MPNSFFFIKIDNSSKNNSNNNINNITPTPQSKVGSTSSDTKNVTSSLMHLSLTVTNNEKYHHRNKLKEK